MVSLDQAPHSRRPDRATLLLMNEALPRQRNSSFLGRPLSVQMLPARTPALKSLLKIRFNGVGGTQTYLSLAQNINRQETFSEYRS
jgi:hypothetical protein